MTIHMSVRAAAALLMAVAVSAVGQRAGRSATPTTTVISAPMFLPPSNTDMRALTAADSLTCVDTAMAAAADFQGPPYSHLNTGASFLIFGGGLGAPRVRVPVAVVYPPALVSSGQQGTVALHYWVNPAGCAEPASFQVTQAADSAMAVAVRAMLRRLRFVVHDAGGKPLWASVDQQFTFILRP